MKLTIIIAINCFVSSVNFSNRADKALTEKSLECRALVTTEDKMELGSLYIQKGKAPCIWDEDITVCASDIELCLTIWSKTGSLWKHVVCKIPTGKGNFFSFGLICYICPGSQKQHFELHFDINKYIMSKQQL
jgi:hypothetical protein